MNCSRCGSELRHGPLYGFCFSTAMSDYRVGLSRPMVVCLHTKQECLERQLAAVTAQRDRAWEACRAVRDDALFEALDVPADARVKAVISEAENVQITTKGETP